MPDRATELATALQNTEDALNALSTKVGVNERTARSAKLAARLALIGFVLDIALTVFVGLGLFGVNHNQDRINSLQTALQVETDRNKESTCAMIALFLQFEPKTTTNPSYTEEQRAQQTQAYQTLHQISDALGCVTK